MKNRNYELSRDEEVREWNRVEIGDVVVCIIGNSSYGVPFEVTDKCVEENAIIINDKIVHRMPNRKYIEVRHLGLTDENSKYFYSLTLEKGTFVSLKSWIAFQEAD